MPSDRFNLEGEIAQLTDEAFSRYHMGGAFILFKGAGPELNTIRRRSGHRARSDDK